MSEPASISSGIATRYATAVFELAKENKTVAKIEPDIASLRAALEESEDLRTLIHSPMISRDEQEKAIAALADAMGLRPIMKNVLLLMAQKRRLFVMPQMLSQLADLIAADKGEVMAEVVSAKKLTKAQSDKLAKTLAARVGKKVKLNEAVDSSLIGGLIVKVGSMMIDTSIRSRLNSLQNAMKEVG